MLKAAMLRVRVLACGLGKRLTQHGVAIDNGRFYMVYLDRVQALRSKP